MTRTAVRTVAALALLAVLPVPARAGGSAPTGWHGYPTRRADAQVVYDAAHGEVVLFGGDNGLWGEDVAGDTWVLRGGRWSLRAPLHSGPVSRFDGNLVYDAARRNVVLFGGFHPTPQAFLSDTWVWDGTRWTSRPVESPPPPRRDASMAYDPATRQVVLFGGYYGQATGFVGDVATYYQDTWTWDGHAWKKHTAGTMPPGRRHANLVYDEAIGRLVLYGGYHAIEQGWDPGEDALGDTWTWDGAQWTEVKGAGPPPRRDAAMAYDAAAKQVVLHGGLVTDRPAGLDVPVTTHEAADTWTFDGKAWTEVKGDGPPARRDATMTYDPATREVLLFGGWKAAGDATSAWTGKPTREDPTDTWTWDGKRWTRRATSGPPGRARAEAVYAPDLKSVVLVGGEAYDGAYSKALRDDLWTWTSRGWVQRFSGGPWSLVSSTAVYDEARGEAVVLGSDESGAVTWTWSRGGWTAHDGTAPSDSTFVVAYDGAARQVVLYRGPDNTWTWDGRSWTKHTGTGPPTVLGGAMVYDRARGKVLFFGSHTVAPDNTPIADTWTWDGKAWTQYTGAAPPGRTSATMVYDEARRQVVLFGGISGSPSVYRSDTWTWDGSGWTSRGTAGPSARVNALAVYDAARRVVALYGGAMYDTKEHTYGDTWTWDGTRWTRRAASGPPVRQFAGLTYDAARQRVLLYGGSARPSGAVLGDTWTWDGSRWALQSGLGPSPRSGASLVYVAASRTTVLSSGIADTWTW